VSPSFIDHPPASGANRAADSGPLAARNDRDAVLAWLALFHDSPHTFANARKEVERLWLWAAEVRNQPISGLTHEDLVLYQRFLQDPQPADHWVASGHYARSHPKWRPFTRRAPGQPPLSRISQRQALTVLDGMFTWLVEAGYLKNNPLLLSRRAWRKGRRPLAGRNEGTGDLDAAAGRWLTRDEWWKIGEAINAMPRDTAREHAHYARARWVFALLYLAELRISELAGGTMGQFFAQLDEGAERWWLLVRGKGGIARKVAVAPDLLDELRAYRSSLGLPRWPLPAEATPLVVAVTGADRLEHPISVSAIHKIVKEVFRRAIGGCEAAGNPGLARRLEKASAHWLRHSGASHLLEAGVSLSDVRDHLGHASVATTNTYVHSADRARHGSIARTHRLGWDSGTEGED
jgi:integrase/recombinase XerD